MKVVAWLVGRSDSRMVGWKLDVGRWIVASLVSRIVASSRSWRVALCPTLYTIRHRQIGFFFVKFAPFVAKM